MAATIKIKNSSTASAVPTSSDLVQGELAVNVTDKRIFTENASGTVVELGTNPSILTLPDGSASAPTLTNDGDTNTGIFFPAADTVGITTGGTERARVDSSGNLGLGTTSPSERLHVVGKIAVSGTNPSIRQTVQNAYLDLCGGTTVGTDPSIQIAGSTTTSDANIVFYNSNTHIFRNSAGSSERMRLDASGNLGVGTTSPAAKLHINETTTGNNYALVQNTTSGNAGWRAKNADGDWVLIANAALRFYDVTASAERARIDSSGNFIVNSTTAFPFGNVRAIQLTGSANGSVEIAHSTSNGSGDPYARFYYNGGQIGSITQNGTTGVLYNLTSDYRLKNNPVPVTGAKEFVMALQPKTWDWWDGSGKGVGFIAHEFMEVAQYSGNGEKDAVDENGNPVYQSIQPSSSEVMAYLVAHIQNLETRLAALEQA